MEMTRKEILNSSEYWQERAETQCFIEHIDCTIQLVDKQQLIDNLREVLSAHMHGGEIDEVLAELDEKMKGE